ncbi:MAG TPA: hypothetical protein VGJ63_10630 [Micromonosporaceae bacterium]|jgi:hypothetical protein
MTPMRTPVVATVLLVLAACGSTAPAAHPTGSARVGGGPANASGSATVQPDAISGFGVGATPGATPSSSRACPVFPPNNVWHSDVSRLPVHRNSAAYVGSIGVTGTVHPDFGAGFYDGGAIGIPVTTVPAGTPGVRVGFDYANESDTGPYPIPVSVKIEAGSDHHIILYDRVRCRAYELFAARRVGGGWRAGSGAIFDLRANALRPAGWTSADAAGLSILAGLVR